MSSISTITTLEGDVFDIRASGIPYGRCDSTSTSTVFTATVPGVTSLHDGVCVLLKNGVVTSAEGFTINVNGLGAKPVYSSMAAATRVSTVFNVNYTMLLVYDETRVSGGCWVVYYGYYTSSNSIGYQVRTNSTVRNAADAFRYYKILFSSTDNTKWVPAASSTTNSATSAKTVNQRPINPFGEIVYCSGTTNYAANAAVTATGVWQQYTLTLGYSFNRTGAALVLTTKKPVYVKCAPQSDGSAIIDADTPYVQDLPSTADGKIYIWLGIAYSATQIELTVNHPVFYYKDGAIRLWTNAPPVDTSNLLTKTDEKVWFEIKTVVPADDGGTEAVIGIVDSSGNRVGVDAIASAYEKSRNVIIYYYPSKSNGEIYDSEISRISYIDTVSKNVEIVSYNAEYFRHMTFTESDNETVLTDSHELYIGDITDLSTVLTTDSYVKVFEIVQKNGNTYIYDYYEGINVDFYGFMGVESSRGAVVRYGTNNCFVTTTDYYNTTVTISYIDVVNGQKRLHEMLFENDWNNNVMVMQSETITIIPTSAADVGAIAEPVTANDDDVLTFDNGDWVAKPPSGGGPGQWTKLIDWTAEEDVMSTTFTAGDNDEVLADCSELWLLMLVCPQTATEYTSGIKIAFSGTSAWSGHYWIGNGIKSSVTGSFMYMLHLVKTPMGIICDARNQSYDSGGSVKIGTFVNRATTETATSYTGLANNSKNIGADLDNLISDQSFEKIIVGGYQTVIGTGSQIRIWGR